MDVLGGDPDVVGKKVSDYLHFKGEDGKVALQTAILEKIRQEATTATSDELGTSVLSANEFLATAYKYKPLMTRLFGEDALTKLEHMENYALKIRDTAVGVPEVASKVGSGASLDTGSSMAVGAQGGKIVRSVATAEKSSKSFSGALFHAAKDALFSAILSVPGVKSRMRS